MNNTIDSIDLIHTQHGWIAKNSQDADRSGNIKAFKTGFTRHAPGSMVQQLIADRFPKHIVYVIGGR